MLKFIILALYILKVLFEEVLSFLNISYMKKYGTEVPDELSSAVDSAKLAESHEYTLAQTRFGTVSNLYGACLIPVFIYSGLLVFYANWIESMGLNFYLSGTVFFLILIYAGSIIEIPFDIYETFVLEKRFGFNKTSLKVWIGDLFKNYLLSGILGGILFIAAFFLIDSFPEYWWVLVWAFYFIFSIFMLYISPYVLEPLFNKFTPIENDELETQLKKTLDKAGIKVSKVFKMDASKRSSHTNAYFSGIGKVKRIVLYDTLLEKLNTEEIVAVLAHEAGHWKKKHIIKMITIYETAALLMIYIAFRIMQSNILLDVFNISNDNFFVKLVLLSFIAGIALFPISFLSNAISRKFEREADSFALKICGEHKKLSSALIKLAKDNLSNLYPHPFYVKFHYSHPPIIERLRFLKEKSSEKHKLN